MEARSAHVNDWAAIEALNQRARRTMPRLWGWEEHLTHDSFVVTEHDGIVSGALFAWSEALQVAWVRVAALDDALEVGKWLDLALPPLLEALRRQEMQTLAWMDYDGWAGPDLRARGFSRFADVITLVKLNRALPDTGAVDARLHLASSADVAAVVAVERAAFTPHWWHNETTMRRRIATSSYFAVAEVADEVVAYAEGALRLPTAHLNRIAVHPAHQGYGIGALLVYDALCTFWHYGAEQVTLNTQTANVRSQRLYCRFGFERTGDIATAWEMHL
jgi:ribosomal protein S18 acetylase RimI-like enzyme